MKMEDIKAGGIYQHIRDLEFKLRVLDFSEVAFTYEWVEVKDCPHWIGIETDADIESLLENYKPVYTVEGFEV